MSNTSGHTDVPGMFARLLAAREVEARRDHARLRVKDTTLWPASSEASGAWLGWLDGPVRAEAHLVRIEAVVRSLRDAAITDVVLAGMGGSSLFAMVLRGAFGGHPAPVDLHVIDSTDPAAVARIESSVDWTSTALVVASKSGGTIETLAHLDRLHMRLEESVGGSAAGRIVIVTDPGSALERRAETEGLGAVVHGDVDVGGRYSALSPFGLLPAALLGVDLDALLAQAIRAMERWDIDPWSDAGPAQLAALMGCGVEAGRDTLYLIVPEEAGGFGAWIEQLVAESSGKGGTGILPVVVGSAADVPVGPRCVVVAIGDARGLDELTVQGVPVLITPWEGPLVLVREAMRWMQATALACAQLGVDPFDQPDVAAAKAATAAALDAGTEPETPVTLGSLTTELEHAGYIALLAYVDPEDPVVVELEAAALALAGRFAVPVTLGIGPRYLHSTGQLHKGGRPDGLHVMIVGDDRSDVAIPGRAYGFSRLKRAQAAGDLAALRDAGRLAYRIDLADPLLWP